MTVTVVNIHSVRPGQRTAPHMVYIDRTSKWGNPYPIGVDGERDPVIRKYKEHLWELMGRSHTSEFSVKMVQELNNKTLMCHCSPKPCHGDVLAAAVQWVIERAQKGEPHV